MTRRGRKRNRVVVEIVTNKPITEKEATQAMNLLIQDMDLGRKPIWANARNIYAQSLRAKSFNKVMTAWLQRLSNRN